MYYNGWGNICVDRYYDFAGANVICHQLGYTGASSYPRAELAKYIVTVTVISVFIYYYHLVMVLTIMI